MKLGFLCPNIPGHLNPMTALARHLQARNHEVVFLYSTTAAGLPFVPAPEKVYHRLVRDRYKARLKDSVKTNWRVVMARPKMNDSVPEGGIPAFSQPKTCTQHKQHWVDS
jgi:UDP:flavonoid glycosyltransferase YjiC (YdhE family)